MVTLGKNDRGADVVTWQRVLAADPKPTTWTSAAGEVRTWPVAWPWPLATDGAFGERTEAATQAWQAEHELLANGLVDAETWVVAAKTPLEAPAIPFVQARNFTLAQRTRIDLVVIHTMESPEKGKTAENVAAWFAGPSAPQASAHDCVDADSIVQCVRDHDVAWHAEGANRIGIGIEHAGYAGQNDSDWVDAYSLAMLERSAKLSADLCRRYDIPAVHLTVADLAAHKRGLCGHIDCSDAFSGGKGHYDPGPRFPWGWYLERVQYHLGSVATIA